MTKDDLINQYFEWLYRLVNSQYPRAKTRYRKLLCYMHGVEYRYHIDMDENRAIDGVALRYRFGYDNNYSDELISEFLGDGPASVLEVMVALSLRCEESIMDDYEKGNRLPLWFWGMVENLELLTMTNPNFDRDYTQKMLDRFLDQRYAPDGLGGLFRLRNCSTDMRTVEIWYQMCWYLDEVISNEPHM